MLQVFAYGSLLWNPGFPHVARHRAELSGYRRALCRLSIRHRGTPEAPGIVAGIVADPAARCVGLCYSVAASDEEATLRYLDEREGAGYERVFAPVHLLESGESRVALVYRPNPDHPTYAANLSFDQLVELAATGRGESGAALDYIARLAEHLRELNVHEAWLNEVLLAARSRAGWGE
jgi:cation transport protein ChaC